MTPDRVILIGGAEYVIARSNGRAAVLVRKDSAPIAEPKPQAKTFAALATDCPLRGATVGAIRCGCGGGVQTIEVATCELATEAGGTGHCTPRNIGNGKTWEAIGVSTRPRACSTCTPPSA